MSDVDELELGVGRQGPVQGRVDVAGLGLQEVAGLLPSGDKRIRVRRGYLERIDQDYGLGHVPKLAD